jgi:hypothetical protein
LIFEEHESIRDIKDFESEVEYEQLLGYLRKKTEERRLTAFDQANDNRINSYIKEVLILETPSQ